MSTTDQAVLTRIQYVLLEPPDLGVTWPSGLWTAAEILAHLNERQDRFLKDTMLLVGLADLTVTAGVRRVALPDDWLTTIDLIWQGSDGTWATLERSNSFEADHGEPAWSIARGTPLVYMDDEAPTLIVQLGPAPRVDGTLHLVYIPQGAELDGTGEVLTVPDEFAASVVKYGALADAFGKDGRGKNLEKAAYCEQRYQLAVDAARIILQGYV